MTRPPRPDDLLALRVPVDLRLSPDGRRVAFTLKASAPDAEGYRMALWLVPADGSAPARQLTLGATRDACPRWSPDGRWLAFVSDRSAVLEAGGAGTGRDRATGRPRDGLRDSTGREIERGRMQAWLLPLEAGEARQLTDLPEDVADIAWSPDSSRLCLVSASRTATRPASPPAPDPSPRRDVRLIDELSYQLNGVGFTHDRPPKLWLVEVASGAVRRITSGPRADEQPAWSPDGRRICFVSNRGPHPDLAWRSDLWVVPAEGGPATRITGGRRRVFRSPAWSPDGRLVAAIGHRAPVGGPSRQDVWVFEADRMGEGRDLTEHADLEVGASMNSDLLGGVEARLLWDAAGTSIDFPAPVEGSMEVWRVSIPDGAVSRLTAGRHGLSRMDAVPLPEGAQRIAAVRLSATEPPDVVAFDVPAGAGPGSETPGPIEPGSMRRLTDLMGEAWSDIAIVEPEVRWHESDGRRIQGWFLPAAHAPDESAMGPDGRAARGAPAAAPPPAVVEIHGGPATLYGWSLMWEWQVLAASGMAVYACNPRGSQGYGQAFTAANRRDWGDGPMTDILAGIDALVADGRVDPERLGLTGGSYGGYLTAWMIGRTDRFRAAVACRGVYDLTSEMLSGDLGGPIFGRYEFGVHPWQDPELYRSASPIALAGSIRTPLLIQHAEQDLRCPITQAEELFSVLRSLRRPVRLMRTPGETHELTRSGAPFRRVEHVERIRAWFEHYLVRGGRGLPQW